MSFSAPTRNMGGASAKNIATIQEGIVLPRFCGWARLPAIWISDAHNRDVRPGGKNHPDLWYANIMAAFCFGPVDEFVGQIYNGDWEADWGRASQEVHIQRASYPTYWDAPVGYINTNTMNTWGDTRARVHWGLPTESPYCHLFDFARDLGGEDHPPYRHVFRIEYRRLALGKYNADRLPNLEAVLGRAATIPSAFTTAGMPAGTLGSGGVNPVCALVDVLCDKLTGFGWDPDRFIVEDWVGLANELNDDKWRMSPVLDAAMDASSLIDQFLEYWDGYRYSRNGKIGIARRPADSSAHVGNVTELTYHDFTKPPELTRKSAAEAANQLTVKFTDDGDQQYKESSVTVYAPANREKAGQPVKEELDAAWLLGEWRGLQWGKAALQRMGAESVEGSLHVLREKAVRLDGEPLDVGDVVLVDQHVIEDDLYVRIEEVSEGDDLGEVLLKVKSERGQFPTPYVAPVDPTPEYESPPSVPLEAAAVIELPAALSDSSGLEVAVLAQPVPGGITGVRVFFSADDSTYSLVATVSPVALGGVLLAAISSGAETLTFESAAFVLDLIQDQGTNAQTDDTLIALVGSEVVSLGSFTPVSGGYSVGVLRGRQGTEAVVHEAGSPIWIIRREDITPIANTGFVGGATGYFKLQPVNYAGNVVEFSDAYYDAPPGKQTLQFSLRANPSDVSITSSASSFYTTYDSEGAAATTPETITLTCSVSLSIPSPAFQWQKWGGAFWTDVEDATGLSLQITPAHIGRYRCVVSSEAGELTTGAVDISASSAPLSPDVSIDVQGVKINGTLVLAEQQAALPSTFLPLVLASMEADGGDARIAQLQTAVIQLAGMLNALGSDAAAIRTGLCAKQRLFELPLGTITYLGEPITYRNDILTYNED